MTLGLYRCTRSLVQTTQYGIRDWITEEAHLMVFEEMP